MTVGVNDYPYRGLVKDSEGDPSGEDVCECVSFCAYRLKWAPQHWGNAAQWPASARAAGYSVTPTAAAGTVACFLPPVDGVGQYGHVAWVLKVYGDTMLVEDYNWAETGQYLQHEMPTAGAQFIYPKTRDLGGDPLTSDEALRIGRVIAHFAYDDVLHRQPESVAAVDGLATKLQACFLGTLDPYDTVASWLANPEPYRDMAEDKKRDT